MALHPIHVPLTIEKLNLSKSKYRLDQVPNLDLYTPLSAKEASCHQLCMRTIQSTTAIPTNIFYQSNVQKFTIDRSTFGKVVYCALRFRISCQTSAVRLLPVPLWFDHIEVWGQSNTKMISRRYGNELWHWNQTLYKAEQFKLISKCMNYNPFGGADLQYLQPGNSQDFYLILPHTEILSDFFGQSLSDQQIGLWLYPTTNTGGIISAGAGTISCDQVDIQLMEYGMDATSKKLMYDLYRNNVVGFPFSDVSLIQTTGTLASNSAFNINLQQLKGMYSNFLIQISPSANTNVNTNEQNIWFDSLGSQGQIDLLSPSNESLFGNGTAVLSTVVQNMLPIHMFSNFQTNPVHASYNIGFGNTFGAQVSGQEDGCANFNGTAYQLRLIPGAAGVSQTFVITADANPTGGYYRVFWQGDDGSISYSANILYSANVAAIQTAVNAIPALVARGLNFTANQSLSAGPVTLTCNQRCLIQGTLNGLDQNLATTTNLVSTVGTYGQDGIVSGGTYNINLFAYRFGWYYGVKTGEFIVSTG